MSVKRAGWVSGGGEGEGEGDGDESLGFMVGSAEAVSGTGVAAAIGGISWVGVLAAAEKQAQRSAARI